MSESSEGHESRSDHGSDHGFGGDGAAAPDGAKPSRLQQLIVEYGVIAVIVLLTLSALSYVGFAVAFMIGFGVEGVGETAGAFGAAAAGWALTKPIRIPVALALTPVVAAVWHKIRGRSPQPETKSETKPEAD
ncbi:MAG: hypothetical protein AAGF11_11210 [Myxococcota bacterium]